MAFALETRLFTLGSSMYTRHQRGFQSVDLVGIDERWDLPDVLEPPRVIEQLSITIIRTVLLQLLLSNLLVRYAGTTVVHCLATVYDAGHAVNHCCTSVCCTCSWYTLYTQPYHLLISTAPDVVATVVVANVTSAAFPPFLLLVFIWVWSLHRP